MSIDRVAIVGAGLAGIACAKSLAAHGATIRVLDKGRSVGGRLATRRVEAGGRILAFDHGAQYMNEQGPAFRAMLDAAGARPWPSEGRRVGVPSMSAIPRALAEGLDVATSREVTAILGEPGAWRLRHRDAAPNRGGGVRPDAEAVEEGPFQAVVLAIPAPQAAALLGPPAPHLAGLLAGVRMAPCWTLMAAFASRLPLPDTLALVGGPVAWAARDSAKPGRDADSECWVVQAGDAWSGENLERPAPEIAQELLAALGRLANAELPGVTYAAAHRWRHAGVAVPLGAPCLWDPELRLGAAGDWCTEARAEAAVDSGIALAATIRNR